MKPLVVGVAGGSGSGKTTVVAAIFDAFGPGEVALLDQDSYYRDFGDTPVEERRLLNFDHPDAVDFPLLEAHLRRLLAGGTVARPCYSFATHCRTGESVAIAPSRVVIVEGILVLDSPGLRELMDVRLFVDAADDIRLIRRIVRDTRERGRELADILEQYQRSVRPMHQEFVEPSKRHADIIIPRGGHNRVAIEMVLHAIRERLKA